MFCTKKIKNSAIKIEQATDISIILSLKLIKNKTERCIKHVGAPKWELFKIYGYAQNLTKEYNLVMEN